jgi:hypothetical protein
MKLVWSSVKEEKFFSLNSLLFVKDINKDIKICSSDKFLFLFLDFEVIIFNYFNDKQEGGLSFNYLTKKNLDFISNDEKIKNVKSDSNFFLISTDLGNLFVLNFDEKDYYIEVTYSFNIRHNYIHDYEILFFEFLKSKNILITLDKHLFLLEICDLETLNLIKNSSFLQSNKNTSVCKNLLMRIEHSDEFIFYTYLKSSCYSVIFSNFAIYYIDFETDGRSEIIFKKDPQSYKHKFQGYVYKDVIYYVKDSNCFSIFDIYNRDNKFTIKLSAKNQLNDLNFFKVLFVEEDYIVITNEKCSTLYFIDKKYKLVHRENILFEPYFIFSSQILIALSLSVIGIKFKACIKEIGENNIDNYIDDLNQLKNFLPENETLKKIEDSFINTKLNKDHLKKQVRIRYYKIEKVLDHLKKYFSKFPNRIKCYDYYELCKIKIMSYVTDINFILSKYQCKLFEIQDKNDFNKISRKIYLKNYEVQRNLILNFVEFFGSKNLFLNYKFVYLIYYENLKYEKLYELINLSKNIRDTSTYFLLKELVKTF